MIAEPTPSANPTARFATIYANQVINNPGSLATITEPDLTAIDNQAAFELLEANNAAIKTAHSLSFTPTPIVYTGGSPDSDTFDEGFDKLFATDQGFEAELNL